MTKVDFGRYSEDYAAHRPGLPAAFYERLDSFIALRGTRVLDLACGPGTVALELAARGSIAVGVDVAEGQITTARRLAEERGLDESVEFRVSRAESTEFDPASFDLVTASQCWHWLDSAEALREVRRVLRPGGILAIIHNAYVAGQSELARDTEALILEFNPGWAMSGANGTFAEEIDEVIRGGLRFVEQFCFDHDEIFSHRRWRGRIRTCNGVGPSLSPDEVEHFDERLDALLREKYPDPVAVRHRLWCVIASTESDGPDS